MNRIILIGNGFDLAHGMKTSYHDFINNYWENTIRKIQDHPLNTMFDNDDITIDKCPSKLVTGSTYKDLENAVKEHKTKIRFKNELLKKITYLSNIDHWVDVENEYYLLLKKAFRKEISYDINKLNSDFNTIKILLGQYLQDLTESFKAEVRTKTYETKKIIGRKIYEHFKFKDFSESSKNYKIENEYNQIKKHLADIKEGDFDMEELNERDRKILGRIDKKSPVASIKELLLSDEAFHYFDLNPDQTLFLNFNYTFIDYLYKNPKEFTRAHNGNYTTIDAIHIHGTTNTKDNNKMIFGFGDELDEDYKLIERLNDNSYLENIKSINYLEANNYKRLLEFVNSGNFQVFIFGHSCGLSDRTMLNTIFEHDNCASIKPFYHLKSENEDNYSDIVRNISRNFNDKAKMRDRVVNKSYCEPLR